MLTGGKKIHQQNFPSLFSKYGKLENSEIMDAVHRNRKSIYRTALRLESCPIQRSELRLPHQPTLCHYWRNAGPWGSALNDPVTKWRCQRADLGLMQKSESWIFWSQTVRKTVMRWQQISSSDQRQHNWVLQTAFLVSTSCKGLSFRLSIWQFFYKKEGMVSLRAGHFKNYRAK